MQIHKELVRSKIGLISHRGNLNGKNPALENMPDYVVSALKFGRVEVDCWFRNNQFYLGHEEPLYKIDKYFLFNPSIIVHCKNLDSFQELKNSSLANVFFQTSEIVTFTSKGERVFHSDVFDHALKEAGRGDILVNLDYKKIDHDKTNKNFSVITDFVDFNYSHSLNKLFDVLILDVDGVLTNGRKIYGNEGSALYKEFCDKDFTAIKRFKQNGIEVILLSGDKVVNENLAKSRGLNFIYARDSEGHIDKAKFLNQIILEYGTDKIAFVGDDYFDLTIMDEVMYSFCPADAITLVKSSADIVLNSNGGEGVVAELFDLVMVSYNEKYTRDSFHENK